MNIIHIKYTEYLNNLYGREDKNYEENEGASKPTGVHQRKLEQRYMKKKRGIEDNHLTQYILLICWKIPFH